MSKPPLIFGPVPAYSNPPINPQYFQPSVFVISALSLGPTTTVTTSVNNNYVVGQLIRLLIPPTYGSVQLNGQEGFVTSIPAANQVIVDINSMGVDPFLSGNNTTQPQIVAVGDVNSGPINAAGRAPTATNIPGSFINISPL